MAMAFPPFDLSGKVALVNNSAALTCGGDCDSAAGVVDFVGYGTANDFEDAGPAPTLTNTGILPG